MSTNSRIYLSEHVQHGGSLSFITALDQCLLGLCVQDVRFIKAETILFLRPLSLCLIHPRSLISSVLSYGGRSPAVSLRAEGTDVAAVEKEVVLPFANSIQKLNKKRETHHRRTGCESSQR